LFRSVNFGCLWIPYLVESCRGVALRFSFFTIPTNTVYEALTVMSEKKTLGQFFIEDTVLKGVLSERDYARKLF
jgi:hypothetical protein